MIGAYGVKKLLDDANMDVEGWLAGKVQSKLARMESTAFVTGTGAVSLPPAGDRPRVKARLRPDSRDCVRRDGPDAALNIDLRENLRAPPFTRPGMRRQRLETRPFMY